MAAQESFAVVIVVGMVLTALLSWCLLVKRCLCRGRCQWQGRWLKSKVPQLLVVDALNKSFALEMTTATVISNTKPRTL